MKEKKRKGKNKEAKEEEQDESFFDADVAFDNNASFYQMNLSRPLLKAIGELKYVHPTPIQAATIPVALLGEYFKIIDGLFFIDK